MRLRFPCLSRGKPLIITAEEVANEPVCGQIEINITLFFKNTKQSNVFNYREFNT